MSAQIELTTSGVALEGVPRVEGAKVASVVRRIDTPLKLEDLHRRFLDFLSLACCLLGGLFIVTVLVKFFGVASKRRCRRLWSWQPTLSSLGVSDGRAGSKRQVIAQEMLRLLAVLSDTFQALLYKCFLGGYALLYVIMSNEMRGIKRTSKDGAQVVGEVVDSRTMYLLRHGESVWNFTFNRGGLLTLVRAFFLLVCETMLLCDSDSVIFDSPLSTLGLQQALTLQKWIDSNGSSEAPTAAADATAVKQALAVLRGEKAAVIITSNLRRAISTVLIAQTSYLVSSKETVCVLSNLQEVTRNPDGLSLAARRSVQDTPYLEKSVHTIQTPSLYVSVLDVGENSGNKGILSTIAQRIHQFSEWVFNNAAKGSSASALPFVVSGHSLFFKILFQLYLDTDHDAKRYKIANCGIIRITFQKVMNKKTGETTYRIPADSVKVVYKGLLYPDHAKTA